MTPRRFLAFLLPRCRHVGFFNPSGGIARIGHMAVAYWMVHASNSLYPTNNFGDAAILFCFLFLYLVFADPGVWSVNKQ